MASSSTELENQVPDLSGSARAILKTYFEETNAIKLPRVHPTVPTVAFTEPQVYHLLRVLIDETLRMSYSTMERMVLDAVEGKPTTAQSRSDHVRKRTRASTPFRDSESDSSDAEED